jgi:hypothetical protein
MSEFPAVQPAGFTPGVISEIEAMCVGTEATVGALVIQLVPAAACGWGMGRDELGDREWLSHSTTMAVGVTEKGGAGTWSSHTMC